VHQRKALGNLAGDSIEPLGNLPANGIEFLDHHRAQLGDERPAFRFDQRALAEPLMALVGEYLAEQLVPSLS
jgi:hypothetical protein